MESLEPKKLSLIRILQILEHHSDEAHPLKHDEIVKLLETEYGMVVERKIIGRNISFLNEAGFDIVTTKKGSYLAERMFENSELRLLIDGVLSSRYITAKHSKDLIDKLCGLSNKYFRKGVKNIYSINEWDKSDNYELFLNIDLIDEAIESKKRITFLYTRVGIDLKTQTTAFHKASPYQMILHNQRYYLMAYEEKWQDMRFYRLDKIVDLKVRDEVATPLESIAGYENGIDYKDLSTAKPYMYTDKSEFITICCSNGMIDQIVDWFGTDVKVRSVDENTIEVTVRSSPSGMVYWAMQYGDAAEIISPPDVRERIKDTIKMSYDRYWKN